LYQTAFIDGFVFSRAWQETPSSFIRALIDTVRNRILRFALELKDELGEVVTFLRRFNPKRLTEYHQQYLWQQQRLCRTDRKAEQPPVGCLVVSALGCLGGSLDRHTSSSSQMPYLSICRTQYRQRCRSAPRRHAGKTPSITVQRPDFYRYREACPKRNEPPRSCCLRADDEQSAVAASV
jgi:hypothetical protein